MNLLTQTNQEALLKVIGENIRHYRRAKKWTQLDLAVMINNHRAQISRIERGEQNLGICTLEKIAQALEVNLSDLIIKNKVQIESDSLK